MAGRELQIEVGTGNQRWLASGAGTHASFNRQSSSSSLMVGGSYRVGKKIGSGNFGELRLGSRTRISVHVTCSDVLRHWRSWCTQKNEAPVRILKFLAIDVQLFTLKFYNVTKTGFEFIVKRFQCALPQVHCSCSCRLQVATTFDTKLSPFYILEIWIMMCL